MRLNALERKREEVRSLGEMMTARSRGRSVKKISGVRRMNGIAADERGRRMIGAFETGDKAECRVGEVGEKELRKDGRVTHDDCFSCFASVMSAFFPTTTSPPARPRGGLHQPPPPAYSKAQSNHRTTPSKAFSLGSGTSSPLQAVPC